MSCTVLCPGWVWRDLCHGQNSSPRSYLGHVASAWAHSPGCREICAALGPALNLSQALEGGFAKPHK